LLTNIIIDVTYLISGIYTNFHKTESTETIENVDQLKQRIMTVWNKFEQSWIDRAVDQWRKRLQVCVRSGRSYFEHLL